MAQHSKTLQAWLQQEVPQGVNPLWAIEHLYSNSCQVTPNSGFFVLASTPEQRHAHALQAVNAGAVVLLYNADHSAPLPPQPNLAQVAIPQLPQRLGELASAFYNHPSQHLRVVGVTGTNGKSTCAYLLAQLLQAVSGTPAAWLGTLGYGLVGQALTPTGMTTLDAISNQRILHELAQQGATQVVMEVSSHGLSQGRMQGLCLAAALFTNLSQDHLDYHGTLQAYAEAKQRLFAWPSLQLAVFNQDDPSSAFMAQALGPQVQLSGYSLKDASAPLYGHSLQFTPQGVAFTLEAPLGQQALICPLLGDFNVQNLLACLAVCVHYYPQVWPQLPQLVAQLQAVPGRMQVLARPNQPTVVVDFAHTPDALAKALQACAHHCKGQLWVVFGCGGQRDRGKRPLMAKAAQTYAQRVIVTSDNPRDEALSQIMTDIFSGFEAPEAIVQIPARADAIAHAVLHAGPEDWILLAGKGHESQQIIGKTAYPFNDYQVAEAALNAQQEPCA